MPNPSFRPISRTSCCAAAALIALAILTGLGMILFKRLQPPPPQTPTAQAAAGQAAAVPSTPSAQQPPAAAEDRSPAAPQFFIVTAGDLVTQTIDPQPAPPQSGPVLPASVEEAGALAGFIVWEPTFLPEGYVLNQINVYPDTGSVGLLYTSPGEQSGGLYLIQQREAFPQVQREVGPSARIEELLIDGAPAEFARGVWEDAGSSDSILRGRWNGADGFGRLLWERDGLHFQISIDEHGDLETARQVAASLAPHFAGRPSAAGPTATAMPEATVLSVETGSPGPLLKTSAGDFEVLGARFVDQVNATVPGPGEKILLIILGSPGGLKPDPGDFSLEAFDRALRDLPDGGVRLQGDDG